MSMSQMKSTLWFTDIFLKDSNVEQIKKDPWILCIQLKRYESCTYIFFNIVSEFIAYTHNILHICNMYIGIYVYIYV